MSSTVGRGRVSGHYIRKRLRTAGWARRMAVFSGLLLVTAILVYRLGGIDFIALKALFLVVLFLVALALLLALGGLARVWRSGHEGGGKATGALFIALVVGAPFAAAAILAAENPAVNSAETDGMLAADIVSGATITEALSGDPSTSQTVPQPAAGGRRFEARAAQVYAVARNVLADKGWDLEEVAADEPQDAAPETGDLGTSGTIDIPLPTARSSVDIAAADDPFARPDSDDYTLKAVARSFLLALPSDVTIRIVEDGAETFVDLRATSRAVAWDLGQNRRFIESFLSALDEAMAGVSAVVPAAEG